MLISCLFITNEVYLLRLFVHLLEPEALPAWPCTASWYPCTQPSILHIPAESCNSRLRSNFAVAARFIIAELVKLSVSSPQHWSQHEEAGLA